MSTFAPVVASSGFRLADVRIRHKLRPAEVRVHHETRTADVRVREVRPSVNEKWPTSSVHRAEVCSAAAADAVSASTSATDAASDCSSTSVSACASSASAASNCSTVAEKTTAYTATVDAVSADGPLRPLHREMFAVANPPRMPPRPLTRKDVRARRACQRTRAPVPGHCFVCRGWAPTPQQVTVVHSPRRKQARKPSCLGALIAITRNTQQ